MKPGNLERIANGAIFVVALFLCGTLAKREFFPRKLAEAADVIERPRTFYSEWRSLDSLSLPLDSSAGSIRVHVFSDLECPYCAEVHQRLVPALYAKYGRDVHVQLIHTPLPSHRFARQAANALECAFAQGRATSFLDVVYAKQDSIGLIPWSGLARLASLPDSAAFERCIQSTPARRVAAGEAASRAYDVRSTPTILVNGWRFTGLPDSTAFLMAVDSIRSGAGASVFSQTP